MNWIVRYCLMLIFLCGIYTGRSQDIFNLADSLLMAGEYQKSGLAYEWIIYSGTTPEEEARAVLGRIQSYKNLELFDEACEYLDQLPAHEFSDSIRSELLYETLLVNYLSGNYEEVQSRFLMGRTILQNSGLYSDSQLLQCLSQMKSARWKLAHSSAESYIGSIAPPEENEALIEKFHTLLDTTNLPAHRNPNTARILSMIIPGSGQIYAGYPGNGLASLGLHILAMGGAIISFTQGLYITGWIGGFGLLQRLYFSGIENAEELSKQKNRLSKEIFIQPASTFILGLTERYK